MFLNELEEIVDVVGDEELEKIKTVGFVALANLVLKSLNHLGYSLYFASWQTASQVVIFKSPSAPYIFGTARTLLPSCARWFLFCIFLRPF